MSATCLRATAITALGLLIFSAAPAAAQGNSENKRFFGVGEPVSAGELPASEFRDALLALEPQARANAMSILRRANTPAADFEHMRVDREGFVFYVDPAPEEVEEGALEEAPSLPEEITAENVFQLHSKPGAAFVLYVDFDGHTLIDTAWNASSGNPALYMRPFSLDGDYSTFSSTEVARIAESWRRVAEDFAPFDIDVTTEEPPFTVLPSGRIAYASNVGHNLVTDQQDEFGNYAYSCGCGGVAYVGVFGNSYYQPGLTYNKSIGSNAMTISHETGHNLNLSHDGTTTSGYYSGHGSGETSWGPIMGAPFGKSVVTWSKNEYPNANNPEDDFAVIDGYLNFRPDDHEDVLFSNATPLVVTGGVNVVGDARVTDPSWSGLANKGIIGNRNDIDLFSMNVGAGLVSLSIDPAIRETYEGNQGANLDIEAKLIDEFGTVVQTSNPDLQIGADIVYNVTVPGTYYLEITGVGRPGGSGYSDYGSVGQYYINGTVPEDSVVVLPPTAPTDLAATLVGENNIELDWTDPATAPEADETGYRVLRSVNGGAFSLRANLPGDSEFFADNNLASGDYAYKLEVFNGAGTDQSNTTAPITIDVPTVAVATGESTTLGSIVSGSYLSTQQVSGVEVLQEQHSGGRPNKRRSYLDHSWFVTGVVPGAAITLVLETSAPPNGEGDNFAFSYRVNGGPWSDIGTLMNGASASFSLALDPTIAGTVEINVVDTDQDTQGAYAQDTVNVSLITVTSSGDPSEQAPVVSILSPADGTVAPGGTSLTFTGEADDFEDGDLSASISWSSDKDGPLGTGASKAVILSGGTPAKTHIVTASVTDSASNTSTASITVVVDDAPAPTTMSVKDLDGASAIARGNKWEAEVTATVRDDLGDPVSGVTVSGVWSNGANGSGSCVTNAAGQCAISKGGMKGNVSSVTFSVTSVAGGSLTYDPSANADTDGDSDGTTIVIAQ